MSADDWLECPICKGKLKKLADSYGKIPQEEYDKLKQELDDDSSDENDTARVDYEYWFNDDGTFEIRISSSCETCGSEWDIRTKAKPKIDDGKLVNE